MSPNHLARRRRYGRPEAIVLAAALVAAIGCGASAGPAWSATGQRGAARPVGAASAITDRAVLDALARKENPSVIVRFRGKADLSAAAGIADRDAQGAYVYETLNRFAEGAQRRTLQALRSAHSLTEANGLRRLWIVNAIAIESLTEAMLADLESSPDVERIQLQDRIPQPEEEHEISFAPGIDAVIGSLGRIKVPDVWALGYKGSGIVVANIDTGVLHTHEALVGKYRGTVSAGVYNHDYNWFDPYALNATPRFTGWHGSHTMGTMVGDNGGAEQIGVAPDAKWVNCIGFGLADGYATTAGILACGQWMIAPTLPSGNPATADPSKRPHVVSNSWTACTTRHSDIYDAMIEAWTAAGIASAFANGNNVNCGYDINPPLGTVGTPASSGKALGVGSTGTTNGAYASHSNKGPTTDPAPGLPQYAETFGYPDLKPNLVAPGVAIRSAMSTGDAVYGNATGTSMSTPMVAGVIGLMWQAAPCLRGNVARTNTLLMQSATRIARYTGSPSDGPGNIPNQATGWGEVNALAAVQAAQNYCLNGAPPSITVAFAPAKVMLDVPSTLTITFASYAAVPAQLSAEFSQALPAGLKIAATPNAATTCPGGVVTAVPGAGSFSLSRTAKIPTQGSTCKLSVDVTSSQHAIHSLVVAPNTLQTTFGNNAYMARAKLQTGYIFPEPYCRADFPEGTSPISRVRFGSIDNITSAEMYTPDNHEDFTGTVVTVVPGNTMRLRVQGNTDGPWLEGVTAYFDWNQNNVFDADERVFVGDLFDSTGVDGQEVEAQVRIPDDALPGPTRMRVVKRYGGAPIACQDSGWGQAEDYTVLVGPSDTTPTLSKKFTPSLLEPNARSVLSISLANRHPTDAAVLSSALVDELPSGVVIATPANASTTCANASLQATPGGTTIGLSGAVSIAPNATCAISVDVVSATAGRYYNTIPAGALKTSLGENSVAATATLKVGLDFPEPYCYPKYYTGVQPITRVKFDTIDNRTSASYSEPPLENFTAMSATVVTGDYLPMRVETVMEGPFPAIITAFFDWNHDNVFDADESVQIGGVADSTGNDGKHATAAIPVPLNAKLGPTRMRVMRNPITPIDACDSNGDGLGQGEDYTVIVIPGTAPPRVELSLTPAMSLVNGTTTARITLRNVNPVPATFTAANVLTLPAGLQAVSAATTCPGSVTFAGGTITLAAGSSIPAAGACEIVASLSSPTAGDYTVLIDAGDLKTDMGENRMPASAVFRVSSSYTFPAPYCAAFFQYEVDPITSVRFAGLFNESDVASTVPHEDFLSVPGANVSAGGKYELTVTARTLVSSNPLATHRVGAYFDWNQDGVFSEDEGYLIGHLNNSTGLDGQFARREIQVPVGTPPGPTRMRVISNFNIMAAACTQTGAGQAEDYTIQVDNVSPYPQASITPTILNLQAVEGGSASGGLVINNQAVGALQFDIDTALAAHAQHLLVTKQAAERRASFASAADGRGKITRLTDAASGTEAPAFVLGDSQISQMADNTPRAGYGVACTIGDQATADNSWWRRFYFNEHPSVGAHAQINAVTVASEQGEPIPVTINVYTVPHGVQPETIPTSQLTLIGTGSGMVGGNLATSTIRLYNTVVVDTAANDVVVEYHIDGSPFNLFLPGANGSPQTHQSFLSSAACGLTQPVSTETLGLAGSHLIFVLDVSEIGDPALGCDAASILPWLSISPASGRIEGVGSAAIAVNANAADLSAGAHRGLICLNTNDPLHPRFEIPLTFTVVPADRLFASGFELGEGQSLLLDPNFARTTGNGGANPYWSGSDTNAANGGTPFYLASAFDSSVRVREGAAWLGGWGASSGRQAFSQQVVLPKGRAQQLQYRRNVLVAPTGTATLNVYVDAHLVASTDLVAQGADAGWTLQSLDIDGYADDQVHTIHFEYVSFGGHDGSVLIDGVTLGSRSGKNLSQ
jgi:subtilisin family serine protease